MTEGNQSGGCGCYGDTLRAEHDPAYRRALWLVIILSLGFGLAEAVGGFVANSQALKADSLDFIGDGSISLLGLLALAWSARKRAQVTLAQGVFLGILGMGVIVFAVWRALSAAAPDAGLMGAIGAVALLINVSVALVLSRFRNGDANVRAIWLFSRNDALANVAVILAAVLVGLTRSAWPDIAVAAVIALLFLHSAREIVGSARREMNQDRVGAVA